MKNFWKYAFYRSLRTVCQTLVSSLPVGIVITPAIIQAFDWMMVYIILAWILTGLLSGVASLLTSIATGLPEVEFEKHLYQYRDEPADSEVVDDDN